MDQDSVLPFELPAVARKKVSVGFDGGQMSTTFSEWKPNERVGYPFYSEHLRFELREKGRGTELVIVHDCSHEDSIHIAQSWGFLKANLKSVIETGRDLRS